MTQLVDVRGQPTPYQLDHGWTIEKQNLGSKYSMLSMILITNKFTYEVLMVEGHLNFFEFEDFGWYRLSENQKSILELRGGLGRCRPPYT